MDLTPELQHAIEQIASSQGISPQEFIIQSLTEKVNQIQAQTNDSITTDQGTQLRRKNGILVIDSPPLNPINLGDLITQLREERDQELMGL